MKRQFYVDLSDVFMESFANKSDLVDAIVDRARELGGPDVVPVAKMDLPPHRHRYVFEHEVSDALINMLKGKEIVS